MILMSACYSKFACWLFWTFHSAVLNVLSSSKDSVSEDVKRRIEGKLSKSDMSAIGELDRGWTGGSVWLVPTDGDVADWEPIARRS